jgi:hypothetical protein
LAIAAPIWLHLRRKKSSNLIQFSTLRFLDDQPQPAQSPLRLRNILLFALRVLALLAVVSAFAWPYLRGSATAPIQESRVYIFDNTLSRQAGETFTRDRDRLAREISQAAPNLQVAVVELTSIPRVVVPFGEPRANAGQKLKQLQPSFQRGSYLAAFRQANSILANSLGVQKRIILLGDNQENQWNENVNTPAFLRDLEVEISKPAAPQFANVWLSEPRVQRIYLGDKSLIHFSVKLTHAGEAASATLMVRANDQVILNRSINLQAQPETIVLQAQWEGDMTSWIRGTATVEAAPDALPADNTVFFSLAPVVEGKVALLAQSPYLRLALSPEIMRGQWAARPIEPAQLPTELSDHRDADVLVIESNYLQSSAARQLLSRYLSNGRGVILLVNRATPAIAGCLRELGFEVEGESSSGNVEKFQYVFSGHPIFHPFLSPDFGNLMDIKISRHLRLRSAHAMPLVFSEKGAALFFQGTKSEGRLFVAAFGLDREHTSWPVHQTFIPFLDLALQSARASDPLPTSFEPGEIVQIQLPPASNVREVVLGDQTAVICRAPVEQGSAKVRLPDKPGLYQVTHDDNGVLQKILSVNAPVKESVLNYVDASETVKAWRMHLNRPLPPSKVRVEASLIGILQQRFWWWMVLAGLLALILEMIVLEVSVRR